MQWFAEVWFCILNGMLSSSVLVKCINKVFGIFFFFFTVNKSMFLLLSALVAKIGYAQFSPVE